MPYFIRSLVFLFASVVGKNGERMRFRQAQKQDRLFRLRSRLPDRRKTPFAERRWYPQDPGLLLRLQMQQFDRDQRRPIGG